MAENKSGDVTPANEPQSITGRENRFKKILLPVLLLLLLLGITVGLLYLYRFYPERVEQLSRYGYLGAFVISLGLNATIVLPAGSIIMVSALGAIMPSPILVGLAGGAGAAIGEISGYLAGYSGRGLARKSDLYEQIVKWMRKWGAPTIFVFSIAPIFFDLAGLAAGVLRFPFWKFLLVCWAGRTILYIFVALAGAWGLETILHYFG